MKNRNKLIWAGIAVVVIVIGFVVINSLHKTTPTNVSQSTSSNPQDIVPGLYPNLIKNDSTTIGLAIKSGMVENNTDPTTGKVVSDHLELQLSNTTKVDMTQFEIFYSITDTNTLKKEGYYKKLTGYTLKAGTTETIHFDNKSGAGHFTANTSSLYYKSTNAMNFDVTVSTPGFKIGSIPLTKAAGGAETKD